MARSTLWGGLSVPKELDRPRRALWRVYIAWNIALVGLAFLIVARKSLALYGSGVEIKSFTFQNYIALSDPLFVTTLGVTLKLAVLVSLIATFLAVAFVLAVWQLNNDFVRKAVLVGLASVYFAGVVPRAQAMVFLLSSQGPQRFLTSVLGTPQGGGMLYTQAGVITGFMPILLPLTIAVVATFRQAIPEMYIDAARDMGANGLDVAFRIVLPLLLPGLTISMVLSFVLVLGDVVIVDLLGGSQVYTLAGHVVDSFKINDWGRASAVTVVMLAIIGALVGVVTAAISRKAGTP